MMYRVTNRNPLTFEREIAESEAQRHSAEVRGFVYGGQGKALDAYDAQQADYAKLAANRAYQERHMGEKARAEAAAFDDSTDEHVPVIPETSIKRRGRPRKVTE